MNTGFLAGKRIQEDMDYAVRKIVNMRIFSDAEGKMNLFIKDIGREVLSISQFTLHADTKKGNRPAFIKAAPPEMASSFYDAFNLALQQEVPTQTGVFGADMQIELVNDGDYHQGQGLCARGAPARQLPRRRQLRHRQRQTQGTAEGRALLHQSLWPNSVDRKSVV